ncbi:MAG: DoxX family membrane protein [Flavobacteriales bacterium]|jgi:uncharacterized membrane protein|nr:DoxX family membrane protein [Flavobacteriales bacterium]
MLPWHQYLMAVIYILAGINHFRSQKIYERIMPPYIPAKKSMVILSGIAEMVFGIMLINNNVSTQNIAAWGIILMLIVFFTVHIHMLQDGAAMKLPKWVLILRIPLQFLLIFWAYQYT